MTSPPCKKLKPWHPMLKSGELEEVTLQPVSFLSDNEIKDKYKYYPHPERLTTEISESTSLWHLFINLLAQSFVCAVLENDAMREFDLVTDSRIAS
jgi:hypothetical protein